jgi:hypothetical protein
MFWKVQGIIFISIDVEKRESAKLRIMDPRETEGSLTAVYSSEILVAFIRFIKETPRTLLDTCAITLAHINHYSLFSSPHKELCGYSSISDGVGISVCHPFT